MITTLSQLIAQIESGNNPAALRYEPLWRYATDALVLVCQRSHSYAMSTATARALCMFSYGKYQIMGSVLYELGYKGSLLQFQNDTTLQDAWFSEFVRQRKINMRIEDLANSPALRTQFALRYNGNAVAYAAKIAKVLQDNGFKVAA